MSDLVCVECGRRVVRRGAPGRYGHASRGAVAACDLDADHVAVPDWAALGPLACTVCGGDVTATTAGRLAHLDADRDADHLPDPAIDAHRPPRPGNRRG